MKFVIILLALAVCTISLPVSWQAAAVGQSTEAAPAPAAADSAKVESDVKEKAEKEKDSDEKPKDKSDSNKQDAAKSDAKSEEKKDTPADAEKSEKKPERKTAQAETKPLKVIVTLDGTFTAEKMTPVALRPKAWSEFEIVEIVEHGAEVRVGQTLVKFDTEKFDDELADLQLQLNVSELAIRKAEEEMPRMEKALAMAATAAERNDKNTREDFDRFHKIDRPLLLKSVEYSLKNAQFQLDYSQDELDQLEKMYEADDLTEETEEIVLKRSRSEVDFAKFNVEQTKQSCEDLLTIRLPRYEIELKESLDKSAMALAEAKASLAIDVNKARYELEQQREARAKSLDRHAKLLADRALLELKSPADGILYYGECENGSWADMSSLIAKFKPHGNVPADTVVMTILERRPLKVEAQASEAQRPELKVGQAAKVVPPVENAAWLAAKLASITSVPVATGKYDSAFELTASELPEWIVAGMSCKVKVTTYDKQDALVVPKKAVHTDKVDEELKYVWLVKGKAADAKDPETKAERRTVKLGQTSGENVEIVDGLKAGDTISLDDEEKRIEEQKEADAK
jgi:HlyD family secretion protein